MLVALQPMYEESSGKRITFQKRSDLGLLEIEAPNALKNNGVYQGRLNSEEILMFTKEMFEFLSKGKIIKENKKYDYKKQKYGIDTEVYFSKISLPFLE